MRPNRTSRQIPASDPRSERHSVRHSQRCWAFGLVHPVNLVGLVLIALWLPAAKATAWSAQGHRIVGEIAQQNLGPHAGERLSALAGRIDLAQLSTWADFVRSDPAWDFASPWHYINVEDDESLAAVRQRNRQRPGTNDVLEAIELCAAVLRGDPDAVRLLEATLDEHDAEALSGSLELTALALLTHFVGDLHQPLHVGRGDDRGGNGIAVSWHRERSNLHSVWDGGILAREDLSYSEWVRFLNNELGGSIEEPIATGIDAWAQESKDLRPQVYRIGSRTDSATGLPDLGYRYTFEHLGTVQDRLYQAGRRLAALLDEIWTP